MDKRSFLLGLVVSGIIFGSLFLIQLGSPTQQIAPTPKPTPQPAQQVAPAPQPQQPAPASRVVAPGVMSGTGTWRTEATREEVALAPNCVISVTRTGSVVFAGFIQNDIDKGRFESRGALTDRCVTPFQGPFRLIFTLSEVTIAGRKGGIVMELKGTFTGDVRSPEGVRSMSQIEILSGSGGLAGIRGQGVAVGRATLTESSNTYYVEVQFSG